MIPYWNTANPKITWLFSVYVTLVDAADSEKPEVLTCPTNVTLFTSKNPVRVVWNPPTFKDNFDTHPTITSTMKPGASLRWGIHKNFYNATDKAGNRATCKFEIQLGRKLKLLSLQENSFRQRHCYCLHPHPDLSSLSPVILVSCFSAFKTLTDRGYLTTNHHFLSCQMPLLRRTSQRGSRLQHQDQRSRSRIYLHCPVPGELRICTGGSVGFVYVQVGW